MTSKPTVQSVSSDLKSHEAQCAERWKTIFRETEEIKTEVADLNKTLKIGGVWMFRIFRNLANKH